MTFKTDHCQAKIDGDHSHGIVKPQSSRADCVTSFNLEDFPIPNGREENWRFTPTKKIADFLKKN